MRSTVTMPPTNSVKETLRVTEETLKRLSETAKSNGHSSNGLKTSEVKRAAVSKVRNENEVKALEQGPMSKIPNRAVDKVVSTKPLSFVPDSLIDM